MDALSSIPAFEFLLFYGTLIAATIAVCAGLRGLADPTRGMPLPDWPDSSQPYPLAFLRGGPNEVARVVIVSLLERGILRQVEGDDGIQRIGPGPSPPEQALAGLEPLECAAADWFASDRSAAEIFAEGGLSAVLAEPLAAIESRLRSGDLVARDEDARRYAWIAGSGVTVLAAVGGARLLTGLLHGRPVLFLLAMAVIGICLLLGACDLRSGSAPLPSWLGRQVINRARAALASPEPGHAYPMAVVLAGACGVAALEDTAFAGMRTFFGKADRSSAGCGAACGDGCGDGCGGCGGCGCG